jgi:hypothetical protein
MGKRIDTEAEIDWIRVKEQGSDPATPPSGYGYLYAKADGGYWKDDGGTVYGPMVETVPWTNHSGTAVVGWSSYTTFQLYYTVLGDLVYYSFYLDGTSDNATTTIAMPYNNTGEVTLNELVRVRDDGTWSVGTCQISGGISSLVFQKNVQGNGFASSGTKTVRGNIVYKRT